MKPYEITGTIELFPQAGGWHYVRVPRFLSDDLRTLADRGLIPIQVTIQATTWKTSLLPYGNGTHFVALNQKVRMAEHLNLGDVVTIYISPRQPL